MSNKTTETVRDLTCESDTALGERCDGQREVVVEWMPEYLRASHDAAGNSGSYPHNGAERLHVCAACADLLLEDEWCRRL